MALNFYKRTQLVIENWMRLSLNTDNYAQHVIPIMIDYTSADMLNLGENRQCQKMLTKMGDNFPEIEKVILSAPLNKINKRGKIQRRVIMITDKAIYNLKPKDIRKCQRRIDLASIASITDYITSNWISIQIPEAYDYRYEYKDKRHIIRIIQQLYKEKQSKDLQIIQSSEEPLPSAKTINLPRIQTREERYRRYRELIGKDQYDDEIQDGKQEEITGKLIEYLETIKPDDFEFLKVIGRGEFGKVIQVQKKKDNGDIFAMKIISKKTLITQQQTEYESTQRQLTQELMHPFLMNLRYAFQTETKLYFIFNFDHAGELFFHLKKKRRFREETVQLWIAETALVLGYFHALDQKYESLCPENILLTTEGHINLKDKYMIALYGNYKNVATVSQPEYVAPEIIMNLGYGKAVDWWSLGILLYELTVGIPPFYSQNLSEMHRKIREAPLLFPPNMSEACKDLIRKLLSRDPKQRLGSGYDDVEEIKRHSFFKDIDWDKVYEKGIKPPYKPIVRSIDDTPSFDDMFLKEPVFGSYIPPPIYDKHDGFYDFT